MGFCKKLYHINFVFTLTFYDASIPPRKIKNVGFSDSEEYIEYGQAEAEFFPLI